MKKILPIALILCLFSIKAQAQVLEVLEEELYTVYNLGDQIENLFWEAEYYYYAASANMNDLNYTAAAREKWADVKLKAEAILENVGYNVDHTYEVFNGETVGAAFAVSGIKSELHRALTVLQDATKTEAERLDGALAILGVEAFKIPPVVIDLATGQNNRNLLDTFLNDFSEILNELEDPVDSEELPLDSD